MREYPWHAVVKHISSDEIVCYILGVVAIFGPDTIFTKEMEYYFDPTVYSFEIKTLALVRGIGG